MDTKKFEIAHSLGLIPAALPTSTATYATPVSLQEGTFLAESGDPKARALAAVMAVNNAYASSTSSGSIRPRTCR